VVRDESEYSLQYLLTFSAAKKSVAFLYNSNEKNTENTNYNAILIYAPKNEILRYKSNKISTRSVQNSDERNQRTK
jgi:hypothetical protein